MQQSGATAQLSVSKAYPQLCARHRYRRHPGNGAAPRCRAVIVSLIVIAYRPSPRAALDHPMAGCSHVLLGTSPARRAPFFLPRRSIAMLRISRARSSGFCLRLSLAAVDQPLCVGQRGASLASVLLEAWPGDPRLLERLIGAAREGTTSGHLRGRQLRARPPPPLVVSTCDKGYRASHRR